MRTALSVFGIALMSAALIAPLVIRFLKDKKMGQKILEIGPSWHISKQNTPTMGGIIFIFAVTVALIACIPNMLKDKNYIPLLMLGFSMIFGAIGFVDDWSKIRKKQNQGLSVGQKLALQAAAALMFISLLRTLGHLVPDLYIPFVKTTVTIPWIAYLLLFTFVIVGAVNAVNLTDGIDGLCTSVTFVVCIYYSVVLWTAGSIGGLFPIALAGGLLGFILYNKNPARIFMGDTGSLFLGGAVCAMAFAARAPLMLVCVGLVYIIETLSDIIQIVYFKLTGGKRFFKMAPIHHHLEKCGWSENKIVTVFSAVTLLMCAVAYWLG